MRERTNVLVVGDYPPPYGGLSVQVSVLRGLLDASGRHRCRVLDIGESRRERRPECLPARTSIELAARLLRYAAAQWVIHLHTSGHNRKSWLAALACATAGLLNGRKTALSLGSGQAPDWIRQSRGAMRWVVRLTLGLTGTIICRNERSRAAIATLGVPGRKIAVVSGFYGLGPAVDPTLPDAVETFLREHSPVVGAVASIGPEYEEAARDLGAGYGQTLWNVVLPILLPGIIAVALFGFTLSYDEFPRTLIPIGSRNTLPLEIWAMTTNVTSPALYALGTLTTAVSFVVIAVALTSIALIQRRRTRRGTPADAGD